MGKKDDCVHSGALYVLLGASGWSFQVFNKEIKLRFFYPMNKAKNCAANKENAFLSCLHARCTFNIFTYLYPKGLEERSTENVAINLSKVFDEKSPEIIQRHVLLGDLNVKMWFAGLFGDLNLQT